MAKSKRPNDLDGSQADGPHGDAAAAHSSTAPKHKTVEQLMAETPADPPRRHRIRNKLLAVGLVLVLILAFAPQIIGRTALLGKFIAMGTTDLRGSVTCDSASLSWFSPPSATKVGVVDASGNLVALCDEVSCDQGLLDLITAPNKLGRIKLLSPTFNVVVNPDGTTNIEEVIAKFLEPLPPGVVPKTYEGEIEIADGKAEMTDAATQRKWTVDRLSGTVTLPAGTTPLAVNMRGVIQDAVAGAPQPWTCRLNWYDSAAPGKAPTPQGDVELDVKAFPLELANLFGRRFVPALNYAGTLSCNLLGKFDLASAQPTAEVAGRLNIAQFALSGGPLKSDTLRLAAIEVPPMRASIAQNRLTLHDCTVRCDLAGAKISGVIQDYGRLLTAATALEVAKILAQADGSIEATVDLARIAQAIPHVLRVRDDVRITGGAIGVAAKAGPGPNGARSRSIGINTSGLTAMRGNTPISWDQPLTAELTIGEGPNGPVIEKLRASSKNVLELEGTISATSFDVSASYSLAQLMQQAGQFLDLDGIQLAGQGVLQGSWMRDAGNRFNVAGNATIEGFSLVAEGYAPWSEQKLIVGLQAGGTMGVIPNVEQAVVGIQSAGDELTIRTGQPTIDFASLGVVVPVTIEGRGQLNTWLARIRPFAGLPATMTADGNALLTAEGKFRPLSDLEITKSSLKATPFRLTGYGVAIDEPSGEVTLVGRYAPKQTTITEAKLTTPRTPTDAGTQITVQNLIYSSPTGRAAELKGTMSLETELARFLPPSAAPAAVPGAPTSPPWQFAGALNASAKLEQTGKKTSVSLESIVRNFAVGQGGQALWREPQIRAIGSGVYEPELESATFDRFEVAADAVRVLGAGKVSDFSKTCAIDARGEAVYDLARLAPMLQPYFGAGFSAEGRDTQPFQIVGPLFDPQRGGAFAVDKLAAATRFGWDKLTLYGLPIGKTSFEARLDRGVVRTGLIEMPVSQGKIRIAPELTIGPGPMVLALAPQTPAVLAIDHVAITPEMVSERLKFVMPLVAGTTKVSGLFSLQFDEFRMPIDNPSAGALAGRLQVHDVEIEPGPLVQELAVMLQQPRTAKLARESVVDFKMIQGRIYHQNLEIAFPETSVRTSGSVGVADQTLNLSAEVQLPAKLLGLAQTAAPNTAVPPIRLPIAGTLTKPTIDRDGFRNSVAQLVQAVAGQALQNAVLGGNGAIQRGENAAQGALDRGRGAAEQAIGRGLNRLLGPGAANPMPGTTPR